MTQLVWAPFTSTNSYALYSASRHSNMMLAWAARESFPRPICGLQSYARDGDKNQQLGFNMDGYGKKMFGGSGSSEGVVKVHDASSGMLEDTLDAVQSGDEQCKDAMNGVSYFHHQNNNGSSACKYIGLLALAVNFRQFCEQESEDKDSNGATRISEQCPGSL